MGTPAALLSGHMEPTSKAKQSQLSNIDVKQAASSGTWRQGSMPIGNSPQQIHYYASTHGSDVADKKLRSTTRTQPLQQPEDVNMATDASQVVITVGNKDDGMVSEDRVRVPDIPTAVSVVYAGDTQPLANRVKSSQLSTRTRQKREVQKKIDEYYAKAQKAARLRSPTTSPLKTLAEMRDARGTLAIGCVLIVILLIILMQQQAIRLYVIRRSRSI